MEVIYKRIEVESLVTGAVKIAEIGDSSYEGAFCLTLFQGILLIKGSEAVSNNIVEAIEEKSVQLKEFALKQGRLADFSIFYRLVEYIWAGSQINSIEDLYMCLNELQGCTERLKSMIQLVLKFCNSGHLLEDKTKSLADFFQVNIMVASHRAWMLKATNLRSSPTLVIFIKTHNVYGVVDMSDSEMQRLLLENERSVSESLGKLQYRREVIQDSEIGERNIYEKIPPKPMSLFSSK